MRAILAIVLALLMIFPNYVLADYKCAADLNNDGSVDPVSETATCTFLNNEDKICPLKTYTCTATGKSACPQPGPQMIVSAANFPAGTLSGTRCIYNYDCSYSGQLLQCQLDVLAPTDNVCSGAYGWPFAQTRPDKGVTYAGGTCSYTPNINGVASTGNYINVPLFQCDTTSIYTDGTGSYCPTCPSDVAKPCAIIPAVDPVNAVCSLNQCIPDTTTLDPALIPPDIPDYEAAEECTGVLRIFGGRIMGCRPPGNQTVWSNCCSADEAITDSVGAAGSMTLGVHAVSTVYNTVQAGYYAYQMSQATMSSSFAMEAFGVDRAVIEAARQAAIASSTAGEAATTAAANYLQATLLNPTTIAITVIIIVIMTLLGDGCNQEDITTATLNASGYCHYINTECIEDWFIGGCVQEKQNYCCFNSKLARIVHEQARPQLKSFQPDIWAECRGFTPDEFQMIDFSRVDLSEYFGELATKTQTDIQNNISDGIQKYMDNLQ